LLAGMAFLVVVLQLLVLYVPALSSFFSVVPLNAMDLLIAVGAGFIVLLAIELEKVIRRK